MAGIKARLSHVQARLYAWKFSLQYLARFRALSMPELVSCMLQSMKNSRQGMLLLCCNWRGSWNALSQRELGTSRFNRLNSTGGYLHKYAIPHYVPIIQWSAKCVNIGTTLFNSEYSQILPNILNIYQIAGFLDQCWLWPLFRHRYAIQNILKI